MLNNTAATVYNKAVDQDSDETKYHRTVLPAVHWEGGSALPTKVRAMLKIILFL